MKAEEFLKERGFEWMDFSSRRQFLLIRDLMEAYANQKVLEALEEVTDKLNECYSRELWRDGLIEFADWYKIEVEPKYK